jgi:Zn-dependent oligopeptidase
MDEAAAAIDNQEIDIQEELVDFLTTLRESAGNVLAIVFHQALVAQGTEIERAATQISLKLRSVFSRMSVDRNAIQGLAKTIVQACNDALETYRRIIRHITLVDTKKDMESVRRSYEKIKESMSRY